MTSNERLLRNLLAFQGLFYMAMNLWALVATPSFLGTMNPQGDVFETRRFAALALIMAIFFLVGAWRQDLLRPASFLGLGSAAAIGLVNLFHLPSMGWTLLWLDLMLEVVLAAVFVAIIFFRKDQDVPAAASMTDDAKGPVPPQATSEEVHDAEPSEDDPTVTGTDVRDEIAAGESGDAGRHAK
jgi:tellurite resistance protein TehA-like permease